MLMRKKWDKIDIKLTQIVINTKKQDENSGVVSEDSYASPVLEVQSSPHDRKSKKVN